MIRTVKLLLLWIARSLGLFRIARWITRKGFVIVGWHGVSVHDEHIRLPTYSVTPEQLEQRLIYLRRYHRIVPLSELITQYDAGHIEQRQVALTFDDGMRSFLISANPLLDKYGVPATIYALSSSVERQQQSIPLLIRDLFQQSPLQEHSFTNGQNRVSVPLASRQDKEKAAGTAICMYRNMKEDEAAQSQFLNTLADDLNVDLKKLLFEKTWHYLNQHELSKLSTEGIDVQAHSHSHLNCVEELPQVYSDTVKCIQMLEKVTRHSVTHYCYPSGFWSREVWPELERAGISSAVTCNTGPNYLATPKLALRRFMDEHRVSQIEFEFAISGLRWLIHRCAHPFRTQVPYEKKTASGSYF